MILDGKKIALEIRTQIQEELSQFQAKKPSLTVVLIGSNLASLTYVKAKKKACLEAGIASQILNLPENTTEKGLLDTIDHLNCDSEVSGILVQLPLPSHIDSQKVLLRILPEKDVDGFHPLNLGKLLMGNSDGFVPCTPLGVQVLLEKSHIPVEGKHVVIVGRSNIVGKPLAALLMQKKQGCNATVTVAHSGTKNLSELTRSADILVAALGLPLFIKKEMVKPQSVVIDVGIHRVNGKLVGDVDFESVKSTVSQITPVPGGVGPMTIAMLLKNTCRAFTQRS